MLNGILHSDLGSKPCQYGRTFELVGRKEWLQHHVYYLIALACYFLENWLVCFQVYHRSCMCQNAADTVALGMILCTIICTVPLGTGPLLKHQSSSSVFKTRITCNDIIPVFLFLCPGCRKNIFLSLQLA